MFAFLATLFVRGNASGLHHHVALCQEIAQGLCCDHGHDSLHTHGETPAHDGHCPHQCREADSDKMGAAGSLGSLLGKPILRPIAILVLADHPFLSKRVSEKLAARDTWPPPQVHLVRDTVRLL